MLALEGAGIGFWEWTLDSGETRWSANVERLFGLPPGRLGSTYNEFLQVVHPDDRAALEGRCANAQGRRPCHHQVEYRVLRPDGVAHWMADRGQLLENPRRLLGAVWDISERKTLEVHGTKLNRFWAMAGDIHHMLARGREPSTVFREACRIAVDKGLFRFGWVGMLNESNDEVVPVASHGHSDGYLDGARISCRDEPSGRGPTGTAIRENRTVVCNDIEHDELMLPWRARALERDYRASAAFPLRRGGRAVGALMVYAREPRLFDADAIELMERLADNLSFALEQLDLESARQRAEEALRASEARQRALIEQAADAILLIENAKVVDANAAASRLLGREGKELIGALAKDLVAPSGAELLQSMEALGPGESLIRETGLLNKDGVEVPVESSVKRLPDGRLQAIARDVSERKRTMAQLVCTDRLRTLGALAAGVGHEINNPLAYVISNLGSVDEDLRRLKEERRDLDLRETLEALAEAREGVERIRNVVGDLKRFSRGDDLGQSEVDLHKVLDAAANLVRLMLRNRATLVKDYGVLPIVDGDESKLGQVFLNLLVNAGQAIPEGGERAHQVTLSTRTNAQGCAVVEVADTGSGIPPEILANIFDPFFTTKPTGVGTGLGLAICRDIITAHRGSITVESKPGGGTRFSVVLPPHGRESNPGVGDSQGSV